MTPLRLFLLTALASAALLAPQASHAIVPPKTCETVKVSGKRYLVKADQISCRSAVRYSKRWLGARKAAAGYTCKNYRKSQTALKFLCRDGKKQYFAVRR